MKQLLFTVSCLILISCFSGTAFKASAMGPMEWNTDRLAATTGTSIFLRQSQLYAVINVLLIPGARHGHM